MAPDPERWVAYWSAVAGGTFWGFFHLTTAIFAGQPVSREVLIRAFANVAIGIGCGGMLAYFVAPAAATMIPFPTLRDLHAVGFGIGAAAWEVAPFVYRGLRRYAGAKAKGPSW